MLILKFFVETSTIFVSFILIFYIVLRLPKKIIGLIDGQSKKSFTQKSINSKILIFVLYLILILILLNIKG